MNMFIYLLKGIYMIILSIIESFKNIKQNKVIEQNNFDAILISSLVPLSNTKGDDLYFKGVSEILKKKKIKYIKIFINNFGFNHMKKKI